MRSKPSNSLLTAAAMLCRSAAWLPLWTLMLSLFAGSGMICPCCFVMFGLAGACILTARLSFSARSRRAGAAIRIAVLILTITAGTGILYLLTDRIGIPFMIAAVTQCSVMIGAEQSAEKLFPFGAYLAHMIGAVFTVPLLKMVSLPVPQTLLLGTLSMISVLFFLIRNQMMLHRMVNRRSHAETDVPAEIRRGNLIICGGVLLLFAAVILFRAPLLRLISAFGSLVKLVIGTLLRWLFRLVAWLGGKPPEEGGEAPLPADNPVPESVSESPLWKLFWIPVAAIILYFARGALADAFYNVREAFQKWMHQLFRGSEVRKYGNPSDYTDTETLIRQEPRKRAEKRKWKKEYAAWRRLPESKEKFYSGYQLLLTAPAWEKGMIRKSDTVLEIQKKWAHDYEPENLLCGVTEDFQTDRYAEEGLPQEALSDIAQVLEALRKSG